jgi:hypothetical protein
MLIEERETIDMKSTNVIEKDSRRQRETRTLHGSSARVIHKSFSNDR